MYFEFEIFSFLALLKMPPRMKIIIFEFLVLIKYFLFIISILGILVLAHRKKLVQAIVHILYSACMQCIAMITRSVSDNFDITLKTFISTLVH